MHYNKVLLAALALSTSFAEVALAASGGNSDQGGQGGAQDQQGQQAQDQQQNAQASSASSAAQSQGGTPATLDASALQTASNQNGQGNGVAGVKTGQAKANTLVPPRATRVQHLRFWLAILPTSSTSVQEGKRH